MENITHRMTIIQVHADFVVTEGAISVNEISMQFESATTENMSRRNTKTVRSGQETAMLTSGLNLVRKTAVRSGLRNSHASNWFEFG